MEAKVWNGNKRENTQIVCLFVFLALQPIVVVFSKLGSGL
jgi:hypothetical protein